MKSQEYAQALYSATRGKSDEEVDRMLQQMIRILEEKGHKKLLTSIARELEKITERTKSHNELQIRVSKEYDKDTFRTQIDADINALEAQELPRNVVIDETLVGGYELRANGTRINRTYKQTLLTLYNNLITN